MLVLFNFSVQHVKGGDEITYHRSPPESTSRHQPSSLITRRHRTPPRRITRAEERFQQGRRWKTEHASCSFRYRDALRLIHERHAKLRISEKTIRELHRLSRGKLGDAGNYRTGQSEIVEVTPNGRRRVRFKAVDPNKVRPSIAEMVTLWDRCVTERWVHPLIGLAASNLDFLCIHPFRDGNGRVSRLLWLLQSYRLKTAYKEFEERLGQTAAPRGEKTELVTRTIRKAEGTFRVADLQRECPGVSIDLIRATLKRLRATGRVECLGRGQSAEWKRTGRW
jgi:hypothetical protein